MGTEEDRDFCEYVMARQEPLRRSAFLLCRDVHQADDLVQTTITKLYLNWHRACRANSLDAYAYTVLVRVFLDEQRRGWWKVRLTDRTPDRVAEPEDTATRLSVRDALATLRPRHRAVLVLRYYQDLTIEQAADALRCSPGTIKSQTHRALEALRLALADAPEAARAPEITETLPVLGQLVGVPVVQRGA
ncbi:MAG: SigE family RNA polymerase sigma factor [Actinomycetales bacterium]|nr:SigE family RNA polymerase sigma factor [Actinomycetales bacterium]